MTRAVVPAPDEGVPRRAGARAAPATASTTRSRLTDVPLDQVLRDYLLRRVENGGAMTLSWLNPLALAGLAAAALPVIIHLLKRHRATRVPFPTLRFLTDSRAAAVKIRSLSDPMLLILRGTAIVAAVLAAAQPDVVTSWQRAREDRQPSRAIVIDTSSSTNAFARKREEAVALERRANTVVEVRPIGPAHRSAKLRRVARATCCPPRDCGDLGLSAWDHH